MDDDLTPEGVLSAIEAVVPFPVIFTPDAAPVLAAMTLIFHDVERGECASCTCAACVRLRELLEHFQ